MAWVAAIRYRGPTAIVLSRQALPELAEANIAYSEGMGRGAYILKDSKKTLDFTLIATGSEVSLALDVAAALEKLGKGVRVISMPCWQLFDQQPDAYKEMLIGKGAGKKVSIEAGVSFGWSKWIGTEGISISIDSFGASAPQSDLAAEFGFTVDSILHRILA
jgi:transketolase